MNWERREINYWKHYNHFVLLILFIWFFEAYMYNSLYNDWKSCLVYNQRTMSFCYKSYVFIKPTVPGIVNKLRLHLIVTKKELM